ncbi:MAG: immunoglobulin domain-containing protein [Chitinispirillaceae bacterium]|nr:immunoglobulin domain-containing protein [Chitinispirillaceae bacterium]
MFKKSSIRASFFLTAVAALYFACGDNPANSTLRSPEITTQPESQTVDEGGPVMFYVAATGDPAPSYQWLKDGIALGSPDNDTLFIAAAQTTDAGNYSVIVTNTLGADTSAGAALTVNPFAAPEITTQPVSQTIDEGNPVIFFVAATGHPAPSYQWLKDGVALGSPDNDTLFIAAAQTTDAGSYSVIVTNRLGADTSNAATLIVNDLSVPEITTQPVSATVNRGEPVSFFVAASANPAPAYQWQKDGVDILSATSATYTIFSVQLLDAGNYTVIVWNSLGADTSVAAVLTVNDVTPGTPEITTQPLSQTVSEGDPASFTVVATGQPDPGYQWQKDGVDIPLATDATYSIAAVAAADAGVYTVIVSNTKGSVTSYPATLTVNP